MRFITAALLSSSFVAAIPTPQSGSAPSTPANVTLPLPVTGNATSPSPASASPTDVGTSLTNATIISVPGYNITDNTGVGGVVIAGQNAKDGTNYTLIAPFTPAGGDNQTFPNYRVSSNYDFQSLNLALNQELLELDLFHNGLAKFSNQDFLDAGLTQGDIDLLKYMADQEIGHATSLTSAIGTERAAKQCVYQYPFTTVQNFILFNELVTRVGESGVLGFLPHLDSRPAAQVLLQAITTESRQQMIFRQLLGEFPMPVWFETGITQSYAWTIQSQYIKTCPINNPRIEWQNFPALNILNQSDVLSNFVPAISTNRTLTAPGRQIDLSWENPGKKVGPDLNYTTSVHPGAGGPKFVAFISQLNVTYAPLFNINNNTGSVFQPNTTVYPSLPQVNGTMFISIVDDNPFLTVYNLSLINDHTLAGPAIYQSG